jgi:hypothetical protein
MNRGPRQAAGEAASRANDARVARAQVCTGCGRLAALGHFALCPEDPDFIARTAKSEGER